MIIHENKKDELREYSIKSFDGTYQKEIADFVLSIQRQEFGIAITLEDQPDLCNIYRFYKAGLGEFFVGFSHHGVVGTVGILDIGEKRVALRKMFVDAPMRGSGIAQALLDRALQHAKENGITQILLGTIEAYVAAHRFYEKNGFQRIPPDKLPSDFPRMAVDTRFYLLEVVPTD